MIDELKNTIKKNWVSFNSEGECDVNSLSFTKFCQRIAGEHTKVLFFVTYKGAPLCILKVMRSSNFNDKLRKEALAQKEISNSGLNIVSKVFFEDTISDLYIYGEEIAQGLPISRSVGRAKEGEVVKFVSSFPVYGEIKTEELVEVFERYVPKEDAKTQKHIKNLQSNSTTLKTGLTHGDFGRPNILFDGLNIHVIDWERAGEIPIWLTDAVYFIVRARQLYTMEEWDRVGVPLLIKYTGISVGAAKSTYSAAMLFKIFYKKYPELYKKMITEFVK